jgi:aminomuconate-semialdehyde/2-hydroxymuconate-6-semialdehyde dehydrogenase
LAAFSNQGQICLCGSRLYVEKPVYEKFKEAFVEKASQLRVGDPLENETQVGALVSESHMNKVLAYIELAQREGGKILCGGERIKLQGRCANGYFVAPTVIEGLSINCRTNQEEIFGPVVTIEPFETIDELLDKANGVEYGLAANLWTQDINKALYVSEHLEAGIVWVNTWLLRDLRTPFGGMKNSGVGREGGFEALKFFTEPKNVCIKYY